MRNRNWFSLMAAAVLFATCQAYAGVFDDFNNGQLDPAWQVTLQNADGWAHVESGTNLYVYDVNTINSSETFSKVILSQNFLAPGDFLVKSGFSWVSTSYATMETVCIQARSGDKVIAEGAYGDGWIGRSGAKIAYIEPPLYEYGNEPGMLPLSGTAEVTLKRTNGSVSILWNDQVILTGYSNSAVDNVALQFWKDNYPGANFGVLSVDYINAVPEPATILLFGIGSCGILSRRRRV